MFVEAVIGSAIGSALVSGNNEIKTELSEVQRKISNGIEHCEKEISAAVNTLYTACNNNFDVIKRLQILTIYGAHKTSDGNLEYIDGNSRLFYDIVSDTLYMYENNVLVKESRKDGTVVEHEHNGDYVCHKSSNDEIILYCKGKCIYSLQYAKHTDGTKCEELTEFYMINDHIFYKKLNSVQSIRFQFGNYIDRLLPQTKIDRPEYCDLVCSNFDEYYKWMRDNNNTLTVETYFNKKLEQIKKKYISDLKSHRYGRKKRYSILTSMRKELNEVRNEYNIIRKNGEEFGHIIEETDNILKLFK